MSTLHSQTLRLLRKVNCQAVNLLVVEDNDASRRLVLELLRGAGFSHLTVARDAEEAIVQMQAVPPDLILLDWGLPGMSGIDLTELIRAAALKPDPRFPNPEVPIVMLTARQRARDVTHARNAGVNEFVVKPFSTASLLKAISWALVKKRRFVATDAFTGPDRRRRKATLFPGLLRRTEDHQLAPTAREHLNESLAAEVDTLRRMMRGTEAPSALTLDTTMQRLLEVQTRAHDFRMQLIEQATQSLNDYVRYFGRAAENEVLDVHLDALMKLNDVPYAHHEEAISIVTHLKTLVSKRRVSRKVAS